LEFFLLDLLLALNEQCAWCGRRARAAWQFFHNNISQYELYRTYRTTSTSRSYVDDLLKNMATLPIVGVDEMTKKGTQIKLILRLSDGTKILFKPMRLIIVASNSVPPPRKFCMRK